MTARARLKSLPMPSSMTLKALIPQHDGRILLMLVTSPTKNNGNGIYETVRIYGTAVSFASFLSRHLLMKETKSGGTFRPSDFPAHMKVISCPARDRNSMLHPSR